MMFIQLIVAFSLVFCRSINAQPDVKRLFDDLYDNYWARDGFRPVLNSTTTMNIQFGMSLIEILDLDTHNDRIHVSAWERYLWKDELLMWNPEDYNGIVHFNINPDLIWRPDIVLYNSATVTPARSYSLAVVSWDGTVLWVPRTEYKTTCSKDSNSEKRHCHFKFGSWTMDGYIFDPNFYDGSEEIDTVDFVPNAHWKIVRNNAVKNEKYYPCCAEPYPDLNFHLVVEPNSN